MTIETLIIKKAGFSLKRIETPNYKSIFGGVKNYVIALVNQNLEVLHYENEPYFPIGRKEAYAELIKSGYINAECFSFKKL